MLLDRRHHYRSADMKTDFNRRQRLCFCVSVCGSSSAGSMTDDCCCNPLDVLWNCEMTDNVSAISIVKLDWQRVTSDQLQNLSVSADVVIAAGEASVISICFFFNGYVGL
jgi:hypothetical protein